MNDCHGGRIDLGLRIKPGITNKSRYSGISHKTGKDCFRATDDEAARLSCLSETRRAVVVLGQLLLSVALMGDEVWLATTVMIVAAFSDPASCHHWVAYPTAPQPAENRTRYWPGSRPASE